jgi:hypothetical protein
MKTTEILLIGGALVGGYILYQTVVKNWVLEKAGGVAEKYNTDPVFRRKFQEAVKPITDKEANYTYY